jgi:hypothetical protein
MTIKKRMIVYVLIVVISSIAYKLILPTDQLARPRFAVNFGEGFSIRSVENISISRTTFNRREAVVLTVHGMFWISDEIPLMKKVYSDDSDRKKLFKSLFGVGDFRGFSDHFNDGTCYVGYWGNRVLLLSSDKTTAVFELSEESLK